MAGTIVGVSIAVVAKEPIPITATIAKTSRIDVGNRVQACNVLVLKVERASIMWFSR